MLTSLSDLRAAFYLRLLRLYWFFTWKNFHPLARRPGAEQSVLGLAVRKWLPTPSKASLAAIADLVEQRNDPNLLQGLAALFQRAAVVDPKLKKNLLELATHVQELARNEPGCNQLALQVADELEKLLATPKDAWFPEGGVRHI